MKASEFLSCERLTNLVKVVLGKRKGRKSGVAGETKDKKRKSGD